LDEFEEIEIECETTSEIQYDTACTTKRIYVHHNSSLVILNSTEEDVGEYSCRVSTGVGLPLTVTHSYSREMDWMWLIILIAIIIAILVLVLCILCIICCRKRATKAGTYDVHPDEEDGGRQKKNSKHNQSDIQYSINDEIEGILPDGNHVKIEPSGKKVKKPKPGGPIFRPKSSKGSKGKSYTGIPTHSNGTSNGIRGNISGSENSLLDEDAWLGKGMDEDGSFREGRYAQ
jgi:hypothetical protein